MASHGDDGIGQFRVPFASVSKRVQVRNLSYENHFRSQVHSSKFAFHSGRFVTNFTLDNLNSLGPRPELSKIHMTVPLLEV